MPTLNITIACFGEIGRDLLQASQSDGQTAQKLSSKYGFLSESEARNLLSQLKPVSVREVDLQQDVFAALEQLCTGVDPEPAFEMLNYWLYTCAENKQKIAQQDVIDRVNAIGQFFAERAAYHREWFTSIVPIEDNTAETRNDTVLSQEFYRGISARYDHILANVDKPRLGKLNDIAQKFQEKPVVIVHGASGQGKTALAYRYLHEFFPNHWRFQVQLVESRQHALSIATALAGQANALGIAIAVYVDVSPNDAGWVELVKQLSLIKNIQVLVTIREEDFRCASISGVELQFSEIQLQLEQAEAQEIYQFLAETEIPSRFLNFEDAWNRFGSVPLMEFVYLITQGDSLRERLLQQVRRIQDEIRAGQRSSTELDLLRLVSVAAAFEARLKVRDLVRFLGLAVPQRAFELLEKEYLLRRIETGFLVEGLHPIRSSMLADILTDPALFPWAESASACLPLMNDADVGGFLLYAFSRHSADQETLRQALTSFQPDTWVALLGVTKALIWLGIKKYVETNRPLIEEVYRFVNHGWTFMLNFDLADATPNSAESFLSTIEPLLEEDRRQQIEEFRNRQTDKRQIFVPVVSWLSQVRLTPRPPLLEIDWSSMAETLFWVGRLEIDRPVAAWLAPLNLDQAVETLPIETLADIALGLFYGYPTEYQSWLDRNQTQLITRFRQATQTIAWEDDGQTIRSHFAIKLYQPDVSPSEAETKSKLDPRHLVNEAMERLGLFRRLFPNRQRYACRGYGHRIGAYVELHDETEKNIPIENFPLPWLVSVNSTFKSIAEQDFRPNTWEEYAQQVLSLRQAMILSLQQLQSALQQFFRKHETTQIPGNLIPSNQWTHCKQLLMDAPSLPRCAFDERGFVTDHIDRSSSSEAYQLFAQQNLALEKYDAYSKAFHGYTQTLFNYFNQSESVLIVNPYLRDRTNTRAREVADQSNIYNNARLSVLYLGDALKALPKLQQEYRKLLSHFVSSNQLSALETQEQRTLQEIWYLWYFFAFHPNRQFQNASQECAKLFNNKVREVRNSIRRQIQAISFESLQVSLLAENPLWEGDTVLWLAIDGEDTAEVFNFAENVVATIRSAIEQVENNELRHYAITFSWAYIAIVPRVRGRSLNGTAWRFSSILFSVGSSSSQLEWWSFVPVLIPPVTCAELSLLTWSSSRLKTANKLLALVSELALLFAHMKDFERLPELDELGHQQIQPYIQQLTIPTSQILETVLETEATMANTFNELSQSQQINRPALITSMAHLVELHRLILPTTDAQPEGRIEARLDLTEVAEWADRLQEVQFRCFLLYSSWVTDVLAIDLDVLPP
ncbi:MAG: hypothetical protein HC840_02005 [Leptolyngbyaceae cyanobacterium RM2_2_4]|nr:hypothetical protein [Leptolyngbyaceae cyanobacterium SM1_4_3]NJO48449.1 hypothetical protein [Leptolyngbyaceae cyanobacterium RM2_2_4]